MNDVTTKDGRVFYFLANTPYTKKDGTEIELAVWHSQCAECGAPFTIQTPTNGVSEAFGRKHCDAHKLTKEQVSKVWSASMVAAKAAKRASL